MVKVIGVRFKNAGKLYYFDPGEHEPKMGDHAIVETVRGMEIGEVMAAPHELEDDQIVSPLKTIIRVATEQDIRHAQENAEKEKDAYRICQDKIIEHGLDMKLVSAEYTFDNSKIQFYFTSNGRVDFRQLVKDLASIFKTRIDLRQIGVRDEAKMLGGLGPCGRTICCGSFLGDFQPVSIKMAKEQNLSLNPTKISGVCGRLMCCLKYEQDTYEATRKRMPKPGKEVETPEGIGIVQDVNVIKETVRVRIQKGDSSEQKDFPLDEVQRLQPAQPEKKEKPHKPNAEQPATAKEPIAVKEPALAKEAAAIKEEPPKEQENESASAVSPWKKALEDAKKAAAQKNS